MSQQKSTRQTHGQRTNKFPVKDRETIIHVYNETIWYVGNDKNNVEIIQQDQRYLLWTFTTVLYYELISLLELILLAFFYIKSCSC